MEYGKVLCNRGAAFTDLFDTLEDFRESLEEESCLICFQLPFRLHFDFDEYVGIGNGSDVQIQFRFIPAITYFDATGKRVTEGADGKSTKYKGRSRILDCTQCIAAMPLWGLRQRYYEKYCTLSARGLADAVVIPREEKGQTYSLSGSITSKMYEIELSKRAIFETARATRRLLRDYMALSLHEVLIPQLLFSAFSSPREEIYLPLGDSPDLIEGYLKKSYGKALKHVDIQSLKRASKWPARKFSTFEIQILALKRLSDSGEPELALVGLMALVEWLVKNALSDSGSSPKRGAFKLFEQARDVLSVPDNIHQRLFSAREMRNNLAHDNPTSKQGGYDPASARSGAERDVQRLSDVLKVFEEAAAAAFDLFRHLNSRVEARE